MAGRAAPVFDVLGEPRVEPGERVEISLHALATDLTRVHAEPEALAEALVIRLRHAEQVGHHQHREGLAVLPDELAAASGEELVELRV